MPKRGFNNHRFRARYQAVNLGRLQLAVDAGKIDPAEPVDAAALVASGVVRRARDGVRLLAGGELKAGLDIRVAGASKAAVAAVEAAGGSVTLLNAAPAEG